VRIIPGAVWWRVVYWQWRQYIVARAVASSALSPPYLAPSPSASLLYFTDRESLAGLQDPGAFARRMGLQTAAQSECLRFGCALVEFDVPQSGVILPASAHRNTPQGLTVGGAREWCLTYNLPFDETMQVIYVDANASGSRWFEVPL
jgi:hypothetical protein